MISLHCLVFRLYFADAMTKTHIIAQHGNSEDARLVQKVPGMGHVQILATGDVWSDVTIVIGSDFPTQLSR